MFNSIAHPGIGLICDAQNNIFYADLENVWMIDANGDRIIVVPDVHAHELVIDDLGNICGEHYWYDEVTDEFKNYIWKLTPDLELQIIRDTLTGENQDFSFVRNRHFNGYFIKCVEKDCQILEMDNTGKEKVLYSGEFDDVRWKYMSNDGSLYFVDLYSLYVLKPHQRPQMIVEYLHENRFPFSFLGILNEYGVQRLCKPNSSKNIHD